MSELQVNTTQNVNISFKAASVGERILAYGIDLIIKIAYGIVVFQIFFNLLDVETKTRDWDGWSLMALSIIVLAPALFYTLVLESLLEGQTIGKRLLKIKVIKIDGYQAGIGDYFVRWIFRFVEINIAMGMVAVITTVLSSKGQRLGDIAAGTAIINLKNNINISHTILEEISEEYVPQYPGVIKLTDRDATIIKDSFLMAKKNNDHATFIKLRKKIEEVLDIKKSQSTDFQFIEIILKDYNFYTQKM
jgi:uncharacterized RDD family membrane protein YckC